MDEFLLIFIQKFLRNGYLTPFMVFITHTGDYGLLFIAVTAVLMLIPRTRRLGHVIGCSLGIEFIINNVILKNLVARTRPYIVIEELEILIGEQPDYSFPSGHSGVAFAFAAAMLFSYIHGIEGFSKNRSFQIATLLVLLYASILAFSRLYVGVHYPSDVFAGMLLGLITGDLGYLAEKKIFNFWSRKYPGKIPADNR